MAKTEVRYLIGASCCGVVSLALIITSYSTDYWVYSDLSDQRSSAHHGLFTGSLQRATLETVQNYSLHIVCQNPACLWSCRDTEDERNEEISELISSGTAAFKCTPASSSTRAQIITKKEIDSSEFLDYFLWVFTITFLSAALLGNIVAVILNVYNLFANPIEMYTSIDGVFIYYGSSCGFILVALILWGCEYGIHTSKNIAILDTLVGTFKSEPVLQWSYYILIPAGLLQIAAMGLIRYRNHIINRRNADQVIKADDSNNDANTFMY